MVNLLKGCLLAGFLIAVSYGQVPHSRKKRWLVFPKGSSLQLVYCWLLSTFGTRDGIFVLNITVGLAWEIPTDLRQLIIKESKESVESRHRRQLYSKISTSLDRQGVDGNSCILRAICESKRTSGNKLNFLHSLLHGFFTLPDLEEDNEDIEDHRRYKSAEDKYEDCQKHYPCPLEIFHFKNGYR